MYKYSFKDPLVVCCVFLTRVVGLQMIIICESQQFRVAINGQHQLDYKHRVQDLSRIKQLEVLGDVSLLDVRML